MSSFCLLAMKFIGQSAFAVLALYGSIAWGRAGMYKLLSSVVRIVVPSVSSTCPYLTSAAAALDSDNSLVFANDFCSEGGLGCNLRGHACSQH